MHQDIEENVFANVEISESGIYEISGRRRIVNIPRSQIRNITFTRTIAAERPIAQIVFALLLIVVGLYGFKAILQWLTEGGILYIDISFGYLLFLPLGGWLLMSAIKKKMLLLVKMDSDQRKVVFNQNHEIEKVREFLSKSQRQFGYHIFDHSKEDSKAL